MQGDYSRVTFDRRRHFSMVLMQQGRVLLDADYNEQTAILLHYLRQLAADVIGPHGGPASELGFAIDVTGNQGKITELKIGRGRYWVDGFLCENEDAVIYADHLDDAAATKLSDLTMSLLAYLDVWERHITSVEDPRIREVALGGPDTSARAQVVWQVRFAKIENGASGTPQTPLDCLHFEASEQWQSIIANPNNGMLTASTDQGAPPTTPCIASPDARYRGENQLYRVEIHQGGDATKATFKWSRENASVVFPIESIADTLVTVEHLGRDDRYSLEIGDWVEIVDDDTSLNAQNVTPEQLFQVKDIDTTELIVTLNGSPNAGRVDTKHSFLRRWDQQEGDPQKHGLTLSDGAAKIAEGTLLNLEDGIQITFKAANALYRHGDYWLIPARSTGDIEWPDGPQPPRGVAHHYAPLAIVVANPVGVLSVTDLRHRIEPVATCCPKLVVKTDMSNPDLPKFIAVVSPPMQGLTFQWTQTGAGTIQGATNAESLTVLLPGTGTVTAKVEITGGFPHGCTNSASAIAIKNIAVKDVDDPKNTA